MIGSGRKSTSSVISTTAVSEDEKLPGSVKHVLQIGMIEFSVYITTFDPVALPQVYNCASQANNSGRNRFFLAGVEMKLFQFEQFSPKHHHDKP